MEEPLTLEDVEICAKFLHSVLSQNLNKIADKLRTMERIRRNNSAKVNNSLFKRLLEVLIECGVPPPIEHDYDLRKITQKNKKFKKAMRKQRPKLGKEERERHNALQREVRENMKRMKEKKRKEKEEREKETKGGDKEEQHQQQREKEEREKVKEKDEKSKERTSDRNNREKEGEKRSLSMEKEKDRKRDRKRSSSSASVSPQTKRAASPAVPFKKTHSFDSGTDPETIVDADSSDTNLASRLKRDQRVSKEKETPSLTSSRDSDDPLSAGEKDRLKKSVSEPHPDSEDEREDPQVCWDSDDEDDARASKPHKSSSKKHESSSSSDKPSESSNGRTSDEPKSPGAWVKRTPKELSIPRREFPPIPPVSPLLIYFLV